jgi:transposase, IS5 family
MFKVLILQTSHSLSDERTEFLIKDRLSFMRFLGLGLSDPGPDANTIWTFREALTRAQIEGKPAIQVLFSAYEAALRAAGFLAMGGQIVDATVVAAPKQRNSEAEKADLKAGRVPDAWAVKPAKLARDETGTRAGRSSGRRPSRPRTGRSGSTSRCPLSATRTTSASTAATG